VNFNVGYYDEYGSLVVGLRASRRHYVRRWDGFFLEVLSIVPMELLMLVFHNIMVHYLMLVHMLRVVFIKRFIKNLQSKINVKYCRPIRYLFYIQ